MTCIPSAGGGVSEGLGDVSASALTRLF